MYPRGLMVAESIAEGAPVSAEDLKELAEYTKYLWNGLMVICDEYPPDEGQQPVLDGLIEEARYLLEAPDVEALRARS